MPHLWNTSCTCIWRTAVVTLKDRQDWGCSCSNKEIGKRNRCFCNADVAGLTCFFPSFAPVVDQLVSFLACKSNWKKHLWSIKMFLQSFCKVLEPIKIGLDLDCKRTWNNWKELSTHFEIYSLSSSQGPFNLSDKSLKHKEQINVSLQPFNFIRSIACCFRYRM